MAPGLVLLAASLITGFRAASFRISAEYAAGK